MHDPEKSDSGIVAMKPMNKAGRPAAELAEPRPGTKGNADQQSTHRTQSRARVIQALDRVQQAARQRKKEQWKDLEIGQPSNSEKRSETADGGEWRAAACPAKSRISNGSRRASHATPSSNRRSRLAAASAARCASIATRSTPAR